MPKRYRIVRWKLFMTLVAATCSFIMGLSLSVNQSQTIRARDSVPQASPLTPIRHEIASAPVATEIKKHSIQGAETPELFPESPKSGITTEPQRAKSNIPGGSTAAASPAKSVREQQVEPVSPQILAATQQAGSYPVPKEFQAKVIKNVTLAAPEKVIALTFDDGPWPRTTSQVLDILDKNNIKATFFWIGQNLKAYPQLARQVVANGHAIGNHTWHHWYRQLDEPTAAREIEDTAELIYKTTGVISSAFRPPGGLLNNGVVDYAKKKNYVIVMWSVDSMDYNRLTPGRLVSNVIRKAKPGGIVLLHDGGGNRPVTVEALPQIITQLKEQGYSFVTVPELLAMKDAEQETTIVKKQLGDAPQSSITKPQESSQNK